MNRRYLALLSAAVLAGTVAVSAPAATATPDPSPPPTPWAMPSEIPSATTPGITSGTKVLEFAEVGDKVYAAGTYSEVGGQARSGIAAFNRVTGALDPTFKPTILGIVNAVTPGPTPNTIYVAGGIRSVNGVSLSKVALLDATTGAPIAGFKPPKFDNVINDMKLRGNNLYLAGNFTIAGTTPRGGLASLNPTTGALTTAMTVNLTEHHNTNPTGAQKPIGPNALDITQDGTRMVVVGNFRKADGLDRDQVVQIDLTGTSSTVAPWETDRFKPLCFNWSVDSYVRSVSFSPDGSYFVVGANGGPNAGTLCDSATKWTTYNNATAVQPVWVANSGGDTVWGVAVSDHAVYIGGHMRWMNNPLGSDNANSGAVPRSGLAVLDPLSGVPMTWNPGRRPRGTAVFGLLVARDGVWIGTDTNYVGVSPAYLRPKMAFFPYVGGYNATPTTTPTLPATVYDGRGGVGGATNVLYRVNAGGPSVPSTDSGPDWAGDQGTDFPYRDSGSNAAGWDPAATYDSSVPASTPSTIFDSERWDPTGSPEMQWSFPVTPGVPLSVRLYFANRCSCTSGAHQRVFDVAIDGHQVLNDLDLSGQVGNNVATMKAFNITSDGLVNIDFTHVIENPLINGIEIVRTDAPGGGSTPSDTLSSWSFDGSTSGTEQNQSSMIDWSTVKGAFTVGNKLFMGTPNMLRVASFDGATIGTPQDINPYHDPKWMNVPNGSGGTYNGVTPTFYSQLSSVTGMFYTNGYLYYANGQSTLKSLPFSPDSGIVGGVSSTVSSAMDFSNVGGMFVAGSTLYYVQRSTGNLYSIGWTGTTTTGSSTLVSGPTVDGHNWNGRALFLGNPPVNQPPTAAYTAQCAGLTCHFDGSTSSDADGSVTGWSWTLGDGTTSTNVAFDHTYASGDPESVTLTVTDNDGGTSSSTRTLNPVVTPAGTGFIAQAGTTDSADLVKSVVLPGQAQVGDTLLLSWVGDPASVPADPAGWTMVRSVANGNSLTTVLWTKQATASDLGSTIALTQPAKKRTVAQVLVYRGFSGVVASAAATDSATATHVTPAQAVLSNDLVVAVFADRSSATASWTPGAGQTARGSVVGTTATRFSTFVSDADGRSTTGTDTGTTATTNMPSTKGAGISVVLRP